MENVRNIIKDHGTAYIPDVFYGRVKPDGVFVTSVTNERVIGYRVQNGINKPFDVLHDDEKFSISMNGKRVFFQFRYAKAP